MRTHIKWMEAFNSVHPSGSPEWCKDRRAFIKEKLPDEYARQKHFARLRAKNRYRGMNDWDSLKHRILVERGSRCSECGIKYTGFNIAIFDFHHERDKEFNMATIIRTSKDHKRILDELEKCVIVCSNCHRLLHFYEPKLPLQKSGGEQ